MCYLLSGFHEQNVVSLVLAFEKCGNSTCEVLTEGTKVFYNLG